MSETGFLYSGSELESFSEADNYFGWIMSLFGARIRGRVLEIGAGLGSAAEWLLRQPGTRELVLLEPADNLIKRLRARFSDHPAVSIVQGYFGAVDLGGSFDTVVLINVLEHIEDDAAIVRQAFASLRPGGAFLVFVPALPILFGSLDEEFDHHRRYTRAGLSKLIRGAGLEVRQLRYLHAIGVLGWFLTGKLLRRRTISPGTMRAYDRTVIPWVRRIESLIEPPFGQSLLAIATRPES